jgi:hypothetical protein
MGLFDEVQAPAAKPGRARIIEPKPGRAKLSVGALDEPQGFFGHDSPPDEEQARLWPLLAGCQGGATLAVATKWNITSPPKLMLRYDLRRAWDGEDINTLNRVLFVGMNPSRADAWHDDHTARCYVEFAKRLGFNAYQAVNLSPMISPDPSFLYKPENDPWLIDGRNQVFVGTAMSYSRKIVMCFGSLPIKSPSGMRNPLRGEAMRYSRMTQSGVEKYYCFGMTQDGSPRHLSRLAYNTPCIPWPGYPI